jgi:hypothetical protein
MLALLFVILGRATTDSCQYKAAPAKLNPEDALRVDAGADFQRSTIFITL